MSNFSNGQENWKEKIVICLQTWFCLVACTISKSQLRIQFSILITTKSKIYFWNRHMILVNFKLSEMPKSLTKYLDSLFNYVLFQSIIDQDTTVTLEKLGWRKNRRFQIQNLLINANVWIFGLLSLEKSNLTSCMFTVPSWLYSTFSQ